MNVDQAGFEWSYGGVIRAPRARREIALIFTGGDFAEGTMIVRDTLAELGLPGSFFFTGGFLRETGNRAAIEALIDDGHYLGPHSDEHLLYCPWEERSRTLVTREVFAADLEKNVAQLEGFGIRRGNITWWIPPYEWYNEDISRWSREAGIRLFNFTPGTLSHTDYTEDDAKNFRSTDTILRNVLDFEAKEANGLNGFMLLTHVGAGAKRTDKLFARLGELLRPLVAKNYRFVRVDELLRDAPAAAPAAEGS